MGSKSSSPPQPPDYKGAAQATADSQKYNQSTPLGNMTWSQGPGQQVQTGSAFGHPIFETQPGQWSSNIELNPLSQNALNSQLQSSADVGQLQHGQVQQVADRPAFDM